jgi:hypothetical protein
MPVSMAWRVGACMKEDGDKARRYREHAKSLREIAKGTPEKQNRKELEQMAGWPRKSRAHRVSEIQTETLHG